MPAQPSTPQPLHGITAHQLSTLQGSLFQHTPPASDLDGQVHICCIDEPFHSPHSATDELQDITTLHRFGSMPLYGIGQGSSHIETMNLDDHYTGSIGQSTMDLSYSSLGLNTNSHNSPASIQSTSSLSALSQKGYQKYLGLQNSTYSLKNAASLGQSAPMTYSQQLAQARQQMLIHPGQIPSHIVGRYGSPTSVKSEPWYGYETYGVYNI